MKIIFITYYVRFLFFVSLGLCFFQKSYNQEISSEIYSEKVLSLPPWPHNRIQSIARDSSGYFIISVQDRIYHFSNSLKEIAYTGIPFTLCSTGDGRIFLGGETGFGLLKHFGSKGYNLHMLASGDKLHPGQIHAMIPYDSTCYVLSDSGLFLVTSAGIKKIIQGSYIREWKRIGSSHLFVWAGDTLTAIYSDGLIKRTIGARRGKINLYLQKSSNTLLICLGETAVFSLEKRTIHALPLERTNLSRCTLLKNPVMLPDGAIAELHDKYTLYWFSEGEKSAYSFNSQIAISSKHSPALYLKDGEIFLYDDFTLYRPWIPPQAYYFTIKGIPECSYPGYLVSLDNSIGLLSRDYLTLFKTRNFCGTIKITCSAKIKIQDKGNSFPAILAVPGATYLADPSGIYRLGQTGMKKVFDHKSISIAKISGNRKFILIINDRSFLRIPLETTGNKPYLKSDIEIPFYGNNFHDIGSADGNRIFFTDNAGRVLQLNIDQQKGFHTDTLKISSRPGSYLISYAYGVLLVTETGIMQYDTGRNQFEKDTNLPPLEPVLEWINPYFVSRDGKKIWLVYRSTANRFNNRIIGYENRKVTELRLINDSDYEASSLAEDDSGRLWLAGDMKMIMLNTKASFPEGIPGRILLHNLVFGSDTFLFNGRIFRSLPIKVPFHSNRVYIDFGTSWFGDNDLIMTRYRLEGYMDYFSPWGKETKVEFYGLKPGKYTFYAEAGYSEQKPTTRFQFSFVIQPPGYLRWYAFLFYALILAFALYVFIRYRSWKFMKEKIKLEALISARTEELIREKERTEQLISKMLPQETADELKKKGKATSQKYEMVTVLFSDIQGFTKIAEQMNPETLIDQLDVFYLHFDSVVEKYNIEKIKTIGDAYMCAGGIPEKNRTNPIDVVMAALEMQQYMREMKAMNASFWELRIGIHTGPVIAGVIGQKKYSYDIWGDTVNVASRMESSGEAGKVNISGHTYELVRDFFICEYRGRMPVKYKGEIEMYFVKGIRPELSLNLKDIPNQRFLLMLQKLRLLDLQEYIWEKLLEKAPPELYFHNADYAEEVFQQAELIGRAEGLSEEELLLVRTASLFECPGYILDYFNPVEKSLMYAEELLSKYKYNEEQIEKIKKLILSMMDSEHHWLAEKVLHDARTGFYGRKDFPKKIKAMWEEVHVHGRSVDMEEWITAMKKTLKEFSYYTESARRLAEVMPQEQVDHLDEILNEMK